MYEVECSAEDYRINGNQDLPNTSSAASRARTHVRSVSSFRWRAPTCAVSRAQAAEDPGRCRQPGPRDGRDLPCLRGAVPLTLPDHFSIACRAHAVELLHCLAVLRDRLSGAFIVLSREHAAKHHKVSAAPPKARQRYRPVKCSRRQRRCGRQGRGRRPRIQ